MQPKERERERERKRAKESEGAALKFKSATCSSTSSHLHEHAQIGAALTEQRQRESNRRCTVHPPRTRRGRRAGERASEPGQSTFPLLSPLLLVLSSSPPTGPASTRPSTIASIFDTGARHPCSDPRSPSHGRRTALNYLEALSTCTYNPIRPRRAKLQHHRLLALRQACVIHPLPRINSTLFRPASPSAAAAFPLIKLGRSAAPEPACALAKTSHHKLCSVCFDTLVHGLPTISFLASYG